MKRFTKRIDEHVYYTMGQYPETLAAECTTQDVRQILKHLADYEDLNLMPEEISSLITTIESQKEEIENSRDQRDKAYDLIDVKDAEIESLKAITELAVKGLERIAEHDKEIGCYTSVAMVALSEIERLSCTDLT